MVPNESGFSLLPNGCTATTFSSILHLSRNTVMPYVSYFSSKYQTNGLCAILELNYSPKNRHNKYYC